MKKHHRMRISFMQIALIVTAITTGNKTWELGNEVYYLATANPAVGVSTGYNGGALAFGLICACCLISVVLLESSKVKLID